MKILLLSHFFHPSVGGIETVSDILAHAFHNAGHSVHLMTWTQETGDKNFLFTVIRNPSLKIIFKEHAWADVVVENNPCIRLGWPKVIFRKPSIITLQTWIDNKDRRFDFVAILKKRYLSAAKKVIACSTAVKKACYPQASIIANPYNDALFVSIPGIEKKKEFVFLGRLVSDKGPELAIRAFHLLLQLNTHFNNTPPTLTIIGDGAERAALEELTVSLNLVDDVIFTGALSGQALVNCLNEHRIMLVPSVWNEPFGIVALEGMACGCVPIVSGGGGLPEAVGEAGMSFVNGNVNELAECMRQVTVQLALENSLRAKAAEHLQQHTMQAISKRYLAEVESLQQL